MSGNITSNRFKYKIYMKIRSNLLINICTFSYKNNIDLIIDSSIYNTIWSYNIDINDNNNEYRRVEDSSAPSLTTGPDDNNLSRYITEVFAGTNLLFKA